MQQLTRLCVYGVIKFKKKLKINPTTKYMQNKHSRSTKYWQI